MEEDYKQEYRQPNPAYNGILAATSEFCREILEELEHKLQGEVLIIRTMPNGMQVEEWKKQGKVWVNRRGAMAISSLVANYVNTITISSDLSEQDIKEMMGNFGVELAKYLVLKRKEFDLHIEDISMLHTIILDQVYTTLLKAKNGADRKILSEMVELRETVSQNKGGLGEKLKGLI